MSNEILCWSDLWVYRECCDVRYGPRGLDLCFSHGFLSFDYCCPEPSGRGPPEQQVQVVEPPWQDQHPGCDAMFPWAAYAMTSALLHGPAYHPHTGELMNNVLPATGERWSKAAGQGEDSEQQRHARKLRVRHELSERWKNMGFRSFIDKAGDYYTTGTWDIEIISILTQVISNFAFSLVECTPVALLAGLLKTESLFDLDLPLARRLTRNLRRLMASAEDHGRMAWNGGAEPAPAWRQVLQWAMERVGALEESRQVPNRPWVVDMVLPLCSPKEMGAINEGLRLMGQSLPRKLDETDGWAAGSIRARQAMDHHRIRGQWRHARFRIFIYMVCGTHALLGHDVDTDGDLSQDAAVLSQKIFENLPLELLRLFGGPGVGSAKAALPSVHLGILEEEVPTGDVAVYLHHLARASTSQTLGNITLLLHPDFLEHWRSWKVASLFQSLVTGAWPQHVDFQYLGWRHEGPVTADGRVASHLRYHCDVEPWTGGKIGPCDSGYNPILLQNLWRMAFGRELDPLRGDDLGGYDFSQILVTRRAVMRRPAAYWRYLSRVISARASFELLPGTKFISRKTDLSVNTPFNKNVCAWFEHIWHMLFDPSFFPDGDDKEPDLRYFTTLHDKRLPLGLRPGPDTAAGQQSSPESVMSRHYWFSAEEQCKALKDEQGCRVLKMQQDWRRQTTKPAASMQPPSIG